MWIHGFIHLYYITADRCLWDVYELRMCMRCVWHVCDMRVTCVWHARCGLWHTLVSCMFCSQPVTEWLTADWWCVQHRKDVCVCVCVCITVCRPWEATDRTAAPVSPGVLCDTLCACVCAEQDPGWLTHTQPLGQRATWSHSTSNKQWSIKIWEPSVLEGSAEGAAWFSRLRADSDFQEFISFPDALVNPNAGECD